MSFPSDHLTLSFLTNWEKKKSFRTARWTLSYTKKILDLLQNPQKNFFSLHVAGTKGKGSVCVFAASILRECGYKTGLYTSPHLHDVKERIRILYPKHTKSNKREFFEGKISKYSFDSLISKIWRKNKKKNTLTYFEMLTCLAFFYFAQRKVDVAVVETGLGGRLDATNTLGQKVCAITPVGLEHTEVLGKTIQKIALEKAGIIDKKTRAVIIGPQQPRALAVVQSRAKKLGVEILLEGKDVCFKMHQIGPRHQSFSVKTQKNHYKCLKTSILGPHQAMNAALAIAMVEKFLKIQNKDLHINNVRKGIGNAVWPGRFEVLGRRPFIILDAAHTGESADILASTFRQVFRSNKAVIVLGVFKDKDIKSICRALKPIARKVIFTKTQHPRSRIFTIDHTKELFSGIPKKVISDPLQAVSNAILESKKNDIILITGSIFLISEVREKCIKKA